MECRLARYAADIDTSKQLDLSRCLLPNIHGTSRSACIDVHRREINTTQTPPPSLPVDQTSSQHDKWLRLAMLSADCTIQMHHVCCRIRANITNSLQTLLSPITNPPHIVFRRIYHLHLRGTRPHLHFPSRCRQHDKILESSTQPPQRAATTSTPEKERRSQLSPKFT